MAQENRTYIAIDLKSFYASVECVARQLDPLTTHLVVADETRSEKTICLAISPSLKAYGLPGRARLFEVIQKVKEINWERKRRNQNRPFQAYSSDVNALLQHPEYGLAFEIAMPRMAHYIEVSAKIYDIYLRYIAPEDIHVYSIDEVFMDVSEYLHTYQMSARQLTEQMVHDVYRETGITATAGIGTNLYLCKVAMDIVAKHMEADEKGVRIAKLDEMQYRKLLWNHRPLTDFWRVGRGYAKKLEENGLYTMGDIARCSLGKTEDVYNEELLYQLFGVNAELLIDHAWGWEPCSMADIKAFRPKDTSIGTAQVLQEPYSFEKGKLIVMEMCDMLALDLFAKGLVSDQFVLTIGYDRGNLDHLKTYQGEIKEDFYGRKVPKHAHGSTKLKRKSNSAHLITEAILALYERIVNPKLTIRRVGIAAIKLQEEHAYAQTPRYEQVDLFSDAKKMKEEQLAEAALLEKEKKVQEAVLKIKKRYGKNAILKGRDLEEGATMKERNLQIGGHKA